MWINSSVFHYDVYVSYCRDLYWFKLPWYKLLWSLSSQFEQLVARLDELTASWQLKLAITPVICCRLFVLIMNLTVVQFLHIAPLNRFPQYNKV